MDVGGRSGDLHGCGLNDCEHLGAMSGADERYTGANVNVNLNLNVNVNVNASVHRD